MFKKKYYIKLVPPFTLDEWLERTFRCLRSRVRFPDSQQDFFHGVASGL